MGVADKLRQLRWRAAGHYTRPLPAVFTDGLAGARVLEVGGPSSLFGGGGLLPVYPMAASVDCVQWAAETAWHSLEEGGDFSPDGTPRGRLHVLDDVDLGALPDGAYDAVISSHVIEHIANPLRALAAWRRVSTAGGALLIVAPHKEGTFDHRRPTTTLEHMREDLRADTGEDDLTHLEETLALHDHRRDVAEDDEAWRGERRANPATRVLHHHTFTTPSLLALLDGAGLRIAAVETRFPHDIYVTGNWPAAGERSDNSELLSGTHASPFRADRSPGAGG